jgi:hypothetical protein
MFCYLHTVVVWCSFGKQLNIPKLQMNSVGYGSHEMSSIMKANGGSMDANTYLIYLEQSIIKYRFVGSILSILGGIGVLITTNIKS